MQFLFRRLGPFGRRSLRFMPLVSIVMVALFQVLDLPTADASARANHEFAPPFPARTQPRQLKQLSAQQVEVGFYPMMVYDLDSQSNTYYIDAYMWLRWNGSNNPIGTLEFINTVDRKDLTPVKISLQPIPQSDGTFYQQYHIQGQFFQPFHLQDYPLDEYELSIVLEDGARRTSELVYVPDTDQSGVDPRVMLPGWELAGWTIESQEHVYSTDLGDDTLDTETPGFSNIKYTLKIRRPVDFFLWKLLLPLGIVLLMACSALLIHPTYTDFRLAAPSTALLALIFLQQSYTSTLPEIGYLVLLDKIYVLSYVLMITLMGVAIVTAWWMETHKETSIGRIIKIDRLITLAGSIIFVGGLLFFVVTRS
jgi:hypothetical protein